MHTIAFSLTITTNEIRTSHLLQKNVRVLLFFIIFLQMQTYSCPSKYLLVQSQLQKKLEKEAKYVQS